MKYFTQIPTNFSPNVEYSLEDKTKLIPSGQKKYSLSSHKYEEYRWPKMDTFNFATNSNSRNDHYEKLRKFIIFHSFIFDCDLLVSLFQKERIDPPEGLIRIELEINANTRSFDNVSACIHPNWNSTRLSYRNIHKAFSNLSADDHDLIKTFLMSLTPQTTFYNIKNKLFNTSYWEIIKYVSILDEIIGHGPDCENSNPADCKVCNKRTQSHRKYSQFEWRKQYINERISDEKLQEQYLDIINFAFNKVRHSIVHSPRTPTALRIELASNHEIYDIARSMNDYQDDEEALNSMLIQIRSVTRSLLLNKLFDFKFFPELAPYNIIQLSL